MLEEFKETLRRVLLAKYSIGFIDGYETGKADGYTEGYTDGTKAGGFTDGYRTGKTDGYREGHEGGIKAGGFVDGYETGYEVGYKEGSEDERKGIAEPLSVTIEKAKKDINTAVIMAERNYGLHSSITVLILESVLANVRAGNATVAAMEFEQYKGELLKNE